MKKLKMLLAAGASVAGGLFYYARFFEPAQVVVRQVVLRLPRLDPAFSGYRIVQLSDVHMDSFMTHDRLCRIIEMANAQYPDLAVMTGDFVTEKVRYDADELISAFSRLQARDAVVAVPGNHDHYADPEAIRQIINRSGMRDLSNRVHTLRRNDAALHICGVDDVRARAARLDKVLAMLPKEGAAILLAHEPDFADISAATGRFDLQLSGHSHGGQINIPVLRKLWLPLHGHHYIRGLYNVGDMQLYVNRGLGMITMPLRFRSRPEITVFTLMPSLST